MPLWIVLLLSAVTIFVFMLFFADSAERVVVQATMMGGVAIVISSTLLLLWFLDHPYNAGIGSLRPVAMERAIRILDQEAAAVGGESTIRVTSEGSRPAAETAAAKHLVLADVIASSAALRPSPSPDWRRRSAE